MIKHMTWNSRWPRKNLLMPIFLSIALCPLPFVQIHEQERLLQPNQLTLPGRRKSFYRNFSTLLIYKIVCRCQTLMLSCLKFQPRFLDSGMHSAAFRKYILRRSYRYSLMKMLNWILQLSRNSAVTLENLFKINKLLHYVKVPL